MRDKIKQKYDPLALHLILVRIFAAFLFFFYGIRTLDDSLGMILFLGILIFLILRQYFPQNGYLLIFHGIFIGGLSYLRPEFAAAFFFPAFEAGLDKKVPLILPGLFLGIFRWHIEPQLILILFTGGYIGALFRVAIKERDYYKAEFDLERRNKYETESLNNELISIQNEALQIAELTERNRIAQQLHDDVGHELTGAVLGLQAYASILEEREITPNEKALFDKVKLRVYNSAAILRHTVHNMKPYAPLGIDGLQKIIQDFDDLSIPINVYGNTEKIPIHFWPLLETALKEGLTNILRHTNATLVKVQLDITPDIIRFSLENNGLLKDARVDTSLNQADVLNEGMGLKSLRRRASAYGGSFSATKVTKEDQFLLIIVLPI